MNFDTNVDFLQNMFWQIILTAGPLLMVALAVGLLIGIIQAATSINEMTLSFVPKLIIVLLVFGLLSGYMLNTLTGYFDYTFDQIVAIN
ncbi:MAG: flagellar biosynthesis protein FliQ [Proteobacteria bacterium]|jgi:flagellar biosynthetic protein FliQ|nr:flagellar biosynthesis protein FliQ [Pseudomonadota bacterium]MDA0909260.1 flagellar biosynthesis protein FliQ [Pseudomonadota bacterium]MDA1319812.1 flagellar biosynthesis protein FliQ [Pseudomonadota bacterium]NBR39384.1 flagellar biosynthetic protein FliQ [Alphaproteobacteria bacterium]